MHKPVEISMSEWEEIIKVPVVRESWGLSDETAEQFARSAYAVKFDFISGSPGYVGDLYIIQGDQLTGYPPIVLMREDGAMKSALDPNTWK
jgi:hypothetical protein